MKTKVILLLSIVMLSFACKHSKNASKTTDDKCRLIVSFISKGQGTGGTATMDSVIAVYSKKKGFKLAYDKYPWGREGECNYCFKMAGMKASKQQEFVDAIKNATKNSELIIVTENAVSTHKK